MLSRIIGEFRKSSGPLDLNGLGQRLSVERSALDGMLQLLVRQSKLREAGISTEACMYCAGRLSCGAIQMGNMGKAYELVK